MTTFNLTCEAVEATLPDYLDEILEGWLRESIDEHLSECARCTALVRDLRKNARESASLPALLPEQDVWTAIAGRIRPPVTGSDPVGEKAPLAPVTERIVPIIPTSDSPLPIGEPPAVSSKPGVPAGDRPMLADEGGVLTDERPELTREAAVLATEQAVLASEPPVLRSEPPVVTSERPMLTSEPPFAPSDLWLPTSAPLAPASGPLLPSTVPVPTAAPVHALPVRREKRWQTPAWIGLAAAALVLVSAGTTFFLTMKWVGSARTTNVASETDTRKGSSGERPPAGQRTAGKSPRREQVASDASTPMPPSGQLPPALTVSATASPRDTRSPEEVVYDKEINTLTRIVRRQKSELDPSTITVIEKNLRTLDSAIAQIRAALQEDPGSSLLGGQASRALGMKVELLRRAAMLRSSS
jgi:hypothetical protein